MLILTLLLCSINHVSAANSAPFPQQTAPTDQTPFDPTITNLGFVLANGDAGEQLEWVITVRNDGDVTGTNVVIHDTLHPGLQVDGVETSSGSSSINGQDVIVTIPSLAPGERVQISIFTTILSGTRIDNTACVDAENLDAERCITALSVRALPETGELQHWRDLLLAALVLFLAASLVRWTRE